MAVVLVGRGSVGALCLLGCGRGCWRVVRLVVGGILIIVILEAPAVRLFSGSA